MRKNFCLQLVLCTLHALYFLKTVVTILAEKNCDPLGVITVIDLSAREIGLSCSLTSGLDARPEIQTLNASY